MTTVVTPSVSHSHLTIRRGGHSERKGGHNPASAVLVLPEIIPNSHAMTAGCISIFFIPLSEWSNSGVAYHFALL